MHIVYISQEYPPSLRAGGIASYVKEIAQGMIQLGHQVTVITASDDTRKDSDCMEEQIRVIRLSGGAFFIKTLEGGSNLKKLRIIYRFHSYRRKIKNIVQQLKNVDIVEVADYDAEGLYLNKLDNIPIVVRLHTPSLLNRKTLTKNNAPQWKLHQSLRLQSEEKIFRRAQYITSCSQSLLDWVNCNLPIAPRKIAVIRNPIKVDVNHAHTSESLPPPHEYTIFYAGTISPTKGVAELYHACAKLNAEGIRVKLLLAGKEGIFASQLKADAGNAHHDWCHFLGKLQRNELYTYYASADLCCFPSWWENMPMVCLEAMSYGGLVLGSTSGGMNEIIRDGINGFLTKPQNSEALTKKIKNIIGMDPKELTAIKWKARQTIQEEFSIDMIASQMEKFYEDVIQDFKKNDTIRTYKQLLRVLKDDNQRYIKTGIKSMLIPGFRFTFWLRICSYLQHKNKIAYFFCNQILRHYKYKYGIKISPKTEIGRGLYIGHFGGIVVNAQAKLGKNVNLSHGVTIGSNNRGAHCGVPTIGNNVYIAPGAKIIGNIKIGDNVAIGVNAVVLDDVPDNVSVAGIPARVISKKGAGAEYIQNPVK